MGAEYGRGKSFAPTLPKADMMRLLNNAKSLTINGEVTPVMAWDMLSKDERFDYLSIADFERLTKDLKGRCRCYG